MSEDDLYKQMILALPDDFFNGWKWQAGDKGLCIGKTKATDIIFLGYIESSTCIFAECIIPENDYFRAGLLPETLRPLPDPTRLLMWVQETCFGMTRDGEKWIVKGELRVVPACVEET